MWFSELKSGLEAHREDLEVAFLHHTTLEDINGLFLGVACTARFNLAIFPDEALVQRRLDHDPCVPLWCGCCSSLTPVLGAAAPGST